MTILQVTNAAETAMINSLDPGTCDCNFEYIKTHSY